MKPSLHALITEAICDYVDLSIDKSSELAEQIIKIVRDYHLVEDKPPKVLGQVQSPVWQYEPDKEENK